ncbi:hypothetical protein BJ912DRAFT_956508 [Pholiota molesta]|nr:hypothetical protein BJ912DRAFT_956508 [Pholiota molesta]
MASSTMPPLPAVPDTDPSRAVLDSFRIAIAKRLSETLPLTIEQAFAGIDYGKKGEDFTIAIPRFRLKEKIPEIAEKVIASFTPDEWIESIVLDKSFLHFRVNTPNMIREVLTQVHALSHSTPSGAPEYGANESGKGKKVIIEYSSPNIAKSFHVGHLRSTIIGAFLANLYKACGWETISMNYLGDWGTQVQIRITEELEKDAIKHLFDVYVKVNKDAEADPAVKTEAALWFKRMEDGDEAALKNWRVWREMSVKKYEQEYERLNVHFDVYTGESKGAKLVELEKWKLGKAVVRKKDGTSIYLTRDIGGAIERYEQYKFDKMIYVVLELMGLPWAKDLVHVNYGLVQGMSTRKGTEAGNVMHEQMLKNEEKYNAVEDPEETALEIGITGVKIQDMAAKRINNYTFNWDRMKSFEGDTGPYLQYAHTHEPSGVVTFAFRLAHAISSAWDVVIVKGEEDLEKARAKMFLYESAMRLLSVRPLERM